MKFYLDNHGYGARRVYVAPSGKLEIVMVITSRSEALLLRSLESLKGCALPEGDTEVLAIIYEQQGSKNILTANEGLKRIYEWAIGNSSPRLVFRVIPVCLSQGSGAEMARSLGMSAGAARFGHTITRQGIIACYQAGTLCESNYLRELERHFRENPHSAGGSVYFEHPADDEHGDTSLGHELHTRYYMNSLKYCRHPYAYQSVVPALAIRSGAWQSHNTASSLPDFPGLEDFTHISTTRLIPATPCPGNEEQRGGGKGYHHFQVFEELRAFFNMVEDLYTEESLRSNMDELPETIRAYFLIHGDYREAMLQLKENADSAEQFRERFFQWFSTAETLKYLDFAAEFFFPKTGYYEPLEQLFLKIAPEISCNTARDYLAHLRKMDRE